MGSPFDLADDAAYRRWRDAKLAAAPRRLDELVVDVADPRALRPAEVDAIQAVVARTNFAIVRSPLRDADPSIATRLGAALGLHRLDANWLADEDGVSRIAVAAPPAALRAGPPEGDLTRPGAARRRVAADAAPGTRADFIPYTDRPIRWHTDGYYHPEARRIRGMVLHCVRPAAAGGANALADPERLYVALRDADPALVAALTAADAMTIPAREDAHGVARAAQPGPVFAVDADGTLHLRYTARTRSIEWKADAATRAAADFVERWLASDASPVWRLRLEAGMALVGNNPLHDRAAFVDDPARPRLLYRARFLDRVAAPRAAAFAEAPCRTA